MFNKIILITATLIFFSSCSGNKFTKTDTFLMGTLISVTYQNKDAAIISDGLKNLARWIEEININLDKINNAKIGERIAISSDIYDLLQLAKQYNTLSQKHYDVSIYTLTSLYGFNTTTYMTPDNISVLQARENLGTEYIYFDESGVTKDKKLMIDFGATGKGYLVDKFSYFLSSNGVKNFIINAGGDIFVSGKKGNSDFKIGVKNPQKLNEIIAKVQVENMAVATSGNYERSFTDAHGKFINHIFSAQTKDTVNNYSSVTVIAKTAEIADSFATIFYLLDADSIANLCSRFELPVMVIDLENNREDFCDFGKYEVQ